MELSVDAKKIIAESQQRKALEELIDFVEEQLKTPAIELSELQWTVLINHLNEMLKRSENHEAIQEVDASMFNEVSEESLMIAKKVVDFIGQLPIDEMYVLSIHFEAAKNN
ncbi:MULTISPECIES: PRD domain-containing protein [Enterococcus]|uniref:PRD domain-containing protein n=1 Tax=Enterococcus alishanensis TaxID=1303817 RepID=A0ABS6TCT7_9ENTE|nr:PRD domain-containing protein [Enterococcus alishanensis]MBV7390669.1 PRD domain-containing protein [Enterococcus alishanensis]